MDWAWIKAVCRVSGIVNAVVTILRDFLMRFSDRRGNGLTERQEPAERFGMLATTDDHAQTDQRTLADISVLIRALMSDLAFVERTGLIPEVWLAQCLCESNESLPYGKPVESAKAEEQRIRIRTS